MLFRVWCKDKNEWEKDEVRIDACGNQYHRKTVLHDWMYVRPDNHIVEFNTGITLADGTETFYGDIVRWKDSMFDSKGGDGYRYWILEPERMRRLSWVWTDIVDKNRFRKDIELVGNIHETELTDAMKVWLKE